MYRRYGFGHILVAMAMALILAACGGGRDTSSAGSTSSTAGEATATNTAEPATAVPVGDAANGQAQFDTLCIACHGAGGVGVTGLGKDMTHSEFIAGLTDDELLAFIKQGRDTSSPDNTTGVAMPPKGGNPALTDEQLLDIIAYIRTLKTP